VFDGERQRVDAGGRDLVVPSRRSLLALGDGGGFPAGADESGALEPAEDGINGAAREAGAIHDVESVADAGGDGLEDGDGGGRQRVVRHALYM
jgi:hypothetical protein